MVQKIAAGPANLVPDGYYTRQEVANYLEISLFTLIKWHRNNVFIPTHQMQVGQIKVWLFTDEDIQELARIRDSRHPGPKAKTELA